ncbi:MAG: hypothetical protein FWF51_01380 [Chitinivibrionia bacterium]|nr:hypothetical protein [Chitinivibrionia bacterium]
MRTILIFILISAAISAISCSFNPFFPETSLPPPIKSSPARTVQLLKAAYEQRDIYAFEKLIYDRAEYSSYTQVSHDYEGLTKLQFQLKVPIDDIFMQNRFLPSNQDYYELKWGEEQKIHEKMFSQADEIVFLSPFSAGETIYETSGTDTISAFVKTNQSQIRIKYKGEEFIIDITGQIFAMKKDDDVWKIWKWIELNN